MYFPLPISIPFITQLASTFGELFPLYLRLNYVSVIYSPKSNNVKSFAHYARPMQHGHVLTEPR